MKILVLGNGFMGKPLAQFLEADTSELRLNTIDKELLDRYDVVINTAAKTNIDWCEKNRAETFDTNVVQALRLAKITKGKYVFISSGCIFSTKHTSKGKPCGPINYENSQPNPQCYYTYTKLLADYTLQEIRPDAMILRPRLLISEKSHPRNTIDKLLKYDKILINQESATIMEDMFAKLKELLPYGFGPINMFNEGTISPSEIADLFDHTHKKINMTQLDVITKGKARRVSTILGTHRITPLPPIKVRLKEIRANWHLDKTV